MYLLHVRYFLVENYVHCRKTNRENHLVCLRHDHFFEKNYKKKFVVYILNMP